MRLTRMTGTLAVAALAAAAASSTHAHAAESTDSTGERGDLRPAASAYVALGDSYSAGVGTREQVDDCYRSPHGYPQLIADAAGVALDYQACGGAVTGDVLNNQVGALGADTQHVSITIGGNDIGFADGLTECAKPGWMSDCPGKLDAADDHMHNQLPGDLDKVYGEVTSRAPDATFVVAGYPRLFNGEDCNALTFFSDDEMTRINSMADELSDVTQGRAEAAGATYVDVRGPFEGHAVCDDPEWINGLSNPVVESFHPNREGNVAYADAISPALTGSALPIATPPATPQQAATPTASDYAALVPDLATPANIDKAEAAGIDAQTIKRLDADLRSGDTQRAKDAYDELKKLDAQTD